MVIQPAKANCKLQIIATPIGNLQEITPRALEAFLNCKTILCEDTRVTSKLLSRININDKKLVSFQKFNENEKLEFALKKIKEEQTVLVSDAGYPCLSDPGYGLVNACYKNNIAVEIINGPSSVIHSIVVSGISLNNFYFNGFLPASKNQRVSKLKELKLLNTPIVIFESVHRIKQSLKDIQEIFENPYLVVCRELTKINETIYRGKYDEIIDEIIEKGEFVIIIKPNVKQTEIKKEMSQIILEVKSMIKKENIKLKEACKIIANKNNAAASLVYNAFTQENRVK